jgi:lipopolysaccharide heptosyltransferase I
MATSVLIVKLSSMGDVIHTLPAAQAIRARLPNARLGWAVERRHADIVRGQPWLDEVIEWDRSGPRTFFDFVRRLRQGRWDVAIDFQGLLRSGLVSRLSGARRRIGVTPSREMAHWFYNDRVPLATMERHAVERSVELAERLIGDASGVTAVPIERPYLENAPPVETLAVKRLFPLEPSDDDVRAVGSWLAEHAFDPLTERLVLLNPHCRREANRWPAARFSELAARLLALPGMRVAVVGGPAARELCERIAAPLGEAVWRADGRFSLLGSATLFSRSTLLVTGDTGPMHLAAAVGTPMVALFGASNPLRTGPYTSDAIALNRRLACSPCLARRCPLGHRPPLCMHEISVDQVFSAVLLRLSLGDSEGARKSA